MGFALIGLFLVLFFLGFPVITALAAPVLIYMFLEGFPIDAASQRMVNAMDSYTFVAVPVFILVGNLMNSSGITTKIFTFATTLVARLHGGLAQVNIFASLIFAGMSGAALADVGGLGRIEIRAMRDAGFSREFAAAVTAASATVGPIFPPSIIIIVYGAITSTSIIDLLLAGIIPAICCVAMLMVTVSIISRINKFPRAETWPTMRMVARDGKQALPALLAPVLLIGGMLSGLFTPTEAAAIVVFYVVAVSALYYRDLSWRFLRDAIVETVKGSGAILILVAGAHLMGWMFAMEQIPQFFASSVLPETHNTLVLLLVMNIILLILGMFLDAGIIVLLAMPIIAPPLTAAGVDPIHLGIVAVFNVVLGLVTPPMGLSLFLLSDIARISMPQLLKAFWPFYIPLVITLGLLTVFPALSTWLPSQF